MIDRGHYAERRLAFWPAIFAVAAMGFAAAPADAVAFGTLSYNQRTGTAAPNETIRTSATFTLDPTSAPLVIRSGAVISGGFTDAEFLALGVNPASVTSQTLNIRMNCAGNTFYGCNEPLYLRTYMPTYPVGTNIQIDFSLDPGESITFDIQGLRPNNGPVAPGTYSFTNISLEMIATRLEFYGHFGFETTLAQTTVAEGPCASLDPSCAFTRTVVDPNAAVPEPGTWALMMVGFGAIGAGLRRRRALRPGSAPPEGDGIRFSPR